MRFILVLGVILFCWVWDNIFSFNLGDEIYSSFQRQYNWFASDSYLETPYSSSLSKDPFKDALNDIESMSMQLKIAWLDYIEWVLAEKNCTLSKKKIQSILYYFVPEFRSELVRTLKIKSWEYNNKSFIFDDDEILKYCIEFFECDSYWLEWKNTVKPETSKDPFGRCEEFFKDNYEKWEKSKEKDQNVQISQLWADKYWNSTTDDSPYDIMTDFWNIGTLLYTQAEQPITPVFYNLPMFSNSKQWMKNRKENWSSMTNWWNLWKPSWSQGWSIGKWWNTWDAWWYTWNENTWWNTWKAWWYTWNENTWWNTWNVWWYTWNENTWWNSGIWWSSSNSLSLLVNEIDSYDYDDLIEGLWAASVSQKNTLYYWSLCEDEVDGEVEIDEIESSNVLNDSESDATTNYSGVGYDVNDVSDKELEVLMDYMKWAVDTYLELPKDKKEEIRIKAWNVIRHTEAVTPAQLEIVAKEIKGCYQSCEGLRFDQKASCMLMCACWEIESPIFNPETTPWLWPILMIRFCTVPAVATNFSVWWKKIVSIQEWVNEIYGVADKLSREGKLWMWTQQHNFLDASTKKMDVAKTVAFTISMEFVDVTGKPRKESKQSQEKDIKDINKELQREYKMKNDLDNPVSKNRYRMVGQEWDNVSDVTAIANSDAAKQSLSELSKSPSFMFDPLADSHSNRYIDTSENLVKFLDQQADLWTSINDYMKHLDESAKLLNWKKW